MIIKIIFFVLLVPFLFCQENVDSYINQVINGEILEADKALPQLALEFPNHPSVLFLTGLLEPDGEKAKDIFLTVYKSHPNSYYSDDSVMKIAEYYYAAGLYIQAAEWLKRMALYYSRSEHIERAVKLFLNSLIVSGSRDTALYYSKVFKRQFPKMDVDSKISQLLAEESAKTTSEINNNIQLAQLDKEKSVIDKNSESVYGNFKIQTKENTSTKFPFSLQIGAYSTQVNAENQKKQLIAAGFLARVEEKLSNGRILYVVRIGYYSNRSEAKYESKKIKNSLDIDSIITKD